MSKIVNNSKIEKMTGTTGFNPKLRQKGVEASQFASELQEIGLKMSAAGFNKEAIALYDVVSSLIGIAIDCKQGLNDNL